MCRAWLVAALALALVAGLPMSVRAAEGIFKPVEILEPADTIAGDTAVTQSPDGSSLYLLSQYLAEFLSRVDLGDEIRGPAVRQVYTVGVGELEGYHDLGTPLVSSDSRFLYLSATLGTPPSSSHVQGIITMSKDGSGAMDVLSFTPFPPLDSFAGSTEKHTLFSGPDGRLLYWGGFGGSIVVHRDPATGLLSSPEAHEDVDLGGTIAVSPDGRYAYKLREFLGPGETLIDIFRRDGHSGLWSLAGSLSQNELSLGPSPGVFWQTLQVSRDGSLVYLNGTDGLFVLRRQPDASLQQLDRIDSPDDGYSLVSSPDDHSLYSCGREILRTYERNPSTDSVELVQDLPVMCRAMVVSRTGRRVYVLTDSKLEIYGRDAGTGELTFDQSLGGRELVPPELIDFELAVPSLDGRHVYAYYDDGSLQVLDRDLADNGRLRSRRLATDVPYGSLPYSDYPDMAFDPSGEDLYVLADRSQNSLHRNLDVFRRSPGDGSLSLVQSLPGDGYHLVFSPDGRFLYVRAGAEGTIIFRRDADSGMLSEAGRWDVPSPDRGEAGFAISPDGRSAYATDQASLFVLSRSPATGLLQTVQEVHDEPCPAPTEYTSFDQVFVSPDGRQAYSVDSENQLLLTWQRDPADGTLTISTCDPFRVSPFDSAFLIFLDGGRRVLANNGLFDRDPVSGELTELGGLPNPVELESKSFAVTSDGRNLLETDENEAIAEVWALSQVESPEYPDFRFSASVERPGDDLFAWPVEDCPAETVCLRGAVPDRTETLMRVVGPKPNGRLWPTVVKFSTSPIDVAIEQVSTGEVRRYHLAGSTPGSDDLPGLFDRQGFAPGSAANATARKVHWIEAPDACSAPPPPPDAPVLTSDQFPGFRFQVRVTDGSGHEIPVHEEADCLPETLCVSGAVRGRSELFLRIVGPKPNGYLWPTMVRTSTSTLEVWIEQVATGETRYYRLEGASPGSSDLTGLFDRMGFLPD